MRSNERDARRWNGWGARLSLLVLGCMVARPAFPQVPSTCEGLPNGAACDNGDGCTNSAGVDTCTDGVCNSPKPCLRTSFTPKPGGKIDIEWTIDPNDPTNPTNPPVSCEGTAFVPVDMVERITGVRPPSSDGLVPVTRARNSLKKVPVTGRVRLKLRLNNLGRLLLGSDTQTVTVTARMTLTRANGAKGAANRIVALLRRRR